MAFYIHMCEILAATNNSYDDNVCENISIYNGKAASHVMESLLQPS
jgi:hypothetical protein